MKRILTLGKKILKIPWLIADNVFIVGLFVFFAAFIVAGFSFYKYAVSAEEERGAAPEPFLKINSANYQKFLDFRGKQEAIFNGAGCETCRDIFKKN